MSRFYDKSGEPISMMRWARLLEDRDYATVAYDEVNLTVKVSTVWLGLDHNWFGGIPIIFETMVFTFRDEPYVMPSGHELWWEGVEQYRYSTIEEALAGHAKILAMVQVLEDINS
jgi:hypothetical protein